MSATCVLSAGQFASNSHCKGGPMDYPFAFPLPPSEIAKKRSQILSELLMTDPGFASIPVHTIRKGTLEILRARVDHLFLNDFLQSAYPAMKVTVSNRMTSAAGKFIHSKRMPRKPDPLAEIRMSGDFLFRLPAGEYRVNGLVTSSPQEAFVVVFEHEAVHAVEYALYGATGHSKRFLHLAGGLFGHTNIHHELPTRAQESAKSGIRPGTAVSFPYQGKSLTGMVQRIGKTATVMVPDSRGHYIDTRGRRYSKFRVSLKYLTPL